MTMTHSPPVPPGNQSPYPIQEPPHPPSPPSPPSPPTAKDEGWATPASHGWSLGRTLGAAAGIGAIAIGVAAVLFPREAPAKGKGKKSKK
jgi:hypothetical protein